jgi:predicted DNA repair protein MutK
LWAITKGSFINKLIIVPLALLLNVFLPAAINIILILGGFYFAFEGLVKIAEYFFNKKQPSPQLDVKIIKEDNALEKAKIKSAVTTDFILSVEIVIIALSTVANKSLTIQISTLTVVSILATIGVYGLVGLIVRMDDLGIKLIERSQKKGIINALGELLVKTLPLVIKMFAVVGTLALILVSGGIFSHNIHFLHPYLSGWPSLVKEFAFGMLGGLISLIMITIIKSVSKRFVQSS